ncbi:GPI ethanolamine phosphate transferase 3 [Pelomyxa schiedti]|nr:GPI ethanolamine phosphate transferase 3 [Pelomyxa schiedti]
MPSAAKGPVIDGTKWCWCLRGRVVSFLIFSLALHCAAIYYFTSGFLLSRVQLTETSNCSDWRSAIGGHSSSGNSFRAAGNDAVCGQQPVVDKVVILLVDALRYDFVAPWPSKSSGSCNNFFNCSPLGDIPYSKNFHNQMMNIQQILLQKHNSFLFPFIADPPTSTMQRLKALTTGGIPTFFDVSKNFMSSEISEDNVVHQLTRNKKRITFTGDDTWLGLYPNSFNASFPFPSFDVKDLHTVDNGVMKHFSAQMKQTDSWDVLIGHMLGVDHIGHRYGPNHPEMTKKLASIDNFIRETIDNLPPNCAFIAFGDHGMTQDGNHGGGSEEEVSSALFVVMPQGLRLQSNTDILPSQRYIKQVDLVPTLSFLLGVPIPYGNIGSVIPELFPSEMLPKILTMNSWQVNRYIHQYVKHTNIGEESLTNANEKYSEISDKTLEVHLDTHLHYMNQVFELCSQLWSTFNYSQVAWGIAISILTSLCAGLFLLLPPAPFPYLHTGLGLVFSFILLLLIKLQGSTMPSPIQLPICATVAVSAQFGFLYSTLFRLHPSVFRTLSYSSIASITLVVLQVITSFSNSYIEAEPQIVRFLITTGVAGAFVYSFIRLVEKHQGVLLVWLLMMVFTRAVPCLGQFSLESHQENMVIPASMLTLLCFAPLCALYFLAYKALKAARGVEWGFMARVVLCLIYFAALSLLLYWCTVVFSNVIPAVALPAFMGGSLSVALARFAMIACCVSLLCVFMFPPLPIFVEIIFEQGAVSNLQFGATKAGCLLFCTPVFLCCATALGPSSPLCILAMVLQICAFVWLLDKSNSLKLGGKSICASGFGGVMFALFALQHYAATGHGYELSSIHFDAAFVLFNDANIIVGGAIVVLNTFAAPILTAIALPVAVAFISDQPFNPFSFEHKLAPTVTAFSAFFSLWLSTSMLAAWVCRRHLMVWRLFCPRYLFVAVMVLVVDVALLAAVMFVVRVTGRCAARYHYGPKTIARIQAGGNYSTE